MAQLVPVDHDPFAEGSGRPQITVTPTQRAVLNSVAAGESPDYNTVYGGGRFEEMRDHPRQNIPIRSGPNAGRTSSAAGKYQFLQGTWDEAKNALQLPDFSPDSQDAAAAWLAERDYKKRTGRDLWGDIEANKDNPANLNMIGKALAPTWTSLPGGIEQNRAGAQFGQRLVSELSAQSRGPSVNVKPYTGEQPQQPPQQPKLVPVDHDPFAAQPEMQGPPQRQVGMGEAIGRGALQGASFNFSDEVAGLSAASGIPQAAKNIAAVIPGANLIAPVVGAARMGYEALAGGNEATDRYTQAAEADRAQNALAEKQRPYSYTGGQIAGAVAMPAGAAANAPTLPLRIARGAGVGAVAGGAAGVGEGETLPERVAGGLKGAAIGAGLGGAAPVAVAGVEGIGRGIGALTRPVTNNIAGAVNAEKQAAKTTVDYIGRGTPELNNAEFAAAKAAGQPVANVDRGGEPARALARWAANVSPEARDTIQKFADARFEGQTGRVVEFLRNITGVKTDSAMMRDALQGLARIENRGAYNKAYNAPGAMGMWDEGFEQIAQAPVVQNAIRAASITGANRGTIEGFQRIRSPFTIDKATGQLTLRVDEQGNRILPNLQFWDHVKRNLDKIDTPEARTLNGALKQHLDNLVPEYKQARAGAASFFGSEDAIEAGAKFVSQNIDMREAARVLAKMSPVERDMFKIGFANKLMGDMGNVRDRINIMNQINQTPNAKEKLRMVLGDSGYRQFDALMSVEQSMDKLRGALGNSTTARQLIEYGLAGSVGGIGLTNLDPMTMGIAGAIAGRRYVDQRVAREVARMLTSSDPDVLAKGIRAVAGSQNLMRAFRDFDARLANVGGQNAGAVPSPIVVRADQEKPEAIRKP